MNKKPEKPDGEPIARGVGPGADVSASGKLRHARADYRRRLAHELRTPLSAIVAAAEIMRDERLGSMENERYRDYASDIHDSAHHLLDLVNRVLNHSADQVGPVGLVYANLDARAIIETVASSLRPLAENARLRIETCFEENLPRVIADELSVRQILINLVANAVKFTEPGGLVTISCRRQAGGPFAIEVSDSGRGISDDEIAQVDSCLDNGFASARPGGGHGMGLPLVGELARANNANFKIARGPERGTTATISFGADRLVEV